MKKPIAIEILKKEKKECISIELSIANSFGNISSYLLS